MRRSPDDSEEGPAARRAAGPAPRRPHRRLRLLRYIVRRVLWAIAAAGHRQRGRLHDLLRLSLGRPGAAPRRPQAQRRTRSRRSARSLGLDHSVLDQFWIYIGSTSRRLPARDRRSLPLRLRPQLPVERRRQGRDPRPTCRRPIWLVVGAVILWLAMGIPVGIISAVKRRSLLDRTTMVTTLAFISAPVFWLGLVALYLFAQDVGVIHDLPRDRQLRRRPTTFSARSGRCSCRGSCSRPRRPRSTPATCARSMIDVMSRGLHPHRPREGAAGARVIMRHGVRSAITPIITLLGLDIGVLLAGNAILTETVFNIPGRRGRDRLQRDQDAPTCR